MIRRSNKYDQTECTKMAHFASKQMDLLQKSSVISVGIFNNAHKNVDNGVEIMQDRFEESSAQ